jgi:hypothetical protein
MFISAHIDVSQLIFGFGVVLFLTLVCMLKFQRHRQTLTQARIERGLRGYMAGQTHRAA